MTTNAPESGLIIRPPSFKWEEITQSFVIATIMLLERHLKVSRFPPPPSWAFSIVPSKWEWALHSNSHVKSLSANATQRYLANGSGDWWRGNGTWEQGWQLLKSDGIIAGRIHNGEEWVNKLMCGVPVTRAEPISNIMPESPVIPLTFQKCT